MQAGRHLKKSSKTNTCNILQLHSSSCWCWPWKWFARFMISCLGFSFFFIYGVWKYFVLFLADRSLTACQRKSVLWIFKRAPCRRHFWTFGLSFKEHCFHQFESNLKTRHYEYALIFKGYFIYSFVSMFSFFIFKSYFFQKKCLSYFLKTMINYKKKLLMFYLCFCIMWFYYFYYFIFMFVSLFFMVHYFRINSLNSMAGLEFRGNKENTKTNN